MTTTRQETYREDKRANKFFSRTYNVLELLLELGA